MFHLVVIIIDIAELFDSRAYSTRGSFTIYYIFRSELHVSNDKVYRQTLLKITTFQYHGHFLSTLYDDARTDTHKEEQ